MENLGGIEGAIEEGQGLGVASSPVCSSNVRWNRKGISAILQHDILSFAMGQIGVIEANCGWVDV